MTELKSKINDFISENKKVFAVTVTIGLITHMYILTNFLPNHDAVKNIFGLGMTVSSGRWGLELLGHILPKYEMPWLNGFVSIAVFALSACIIVKMFDIKKKVFQYLVGGMIVSSPALVGTFSYMFTSVAYSIACFFAVIAAYLVIKNKTKHYLLAAAALVISLSIYQAYIFVTSSLIVISLLKSAINDEINAGGVC